MIFVVITDKDHDLGVCRADAIDTMPDGWQPFYSIRAETWQECMEAYFEIQGFGEYQPMRDGVDRYEGEM